MTDLDDPLRWDSDIPDTPDTRAAYARGYRIGLTRGALDAYYGRRDQPVKAVEPRRPPRPIRWLWAVDQFTKQHYGLVLAVFLVASFAVILVAP